MRIAAHKLQIFSTDKSMLASLLGRTEETTASRPLNGPLGAAHIYGPAYPSHRREGSEEGREETA
jgi:hypothetical protein